MPEITDMLGDGEQFLADQQRRFAAKWVHYLRGSSSQRMRATIGRSFFDVTNGNDQLTRVDTHDFLIHATDLKLDGIAIEPQAGDRVVVGNLADGQAYEVGGVAGNDVWRWADDSRLRYRIHTKHVGAHP